MKDFNKIRAWLIPQIDRMGISIEALANAVGVNRSLIYFYLSDTCRPETQTMARICQVLGVPLEEGLRQYTPKLRGRPTHRSRQSRTTIGQRKQTQSPEQQREC